ncbi:hypothetical protein [Vibrio metschnikovii]|uniref:hypothetical protein n=1 Tax=Vibrio metschnikovii TaxID=28172 RepID=UPI002975D964|nr:hypothetical protein [Vibrio metschnikovii]
MTGSQLSIRWYHPSGHEQTRATEQGFSLHHQWSETGLLLEQQLGANKAVTIHPRAIDVGLC